METLDILFHDEHYVAVNKPAGLLVHRSAIDRRETRFALQILRDQLGRRVYPLHRLDKPTSGVLVFALDPQAARRMGEVFKGGGVEKHYVAVVRGYAPEHEVIDYPLVEELDAMTDALADAGKPAQPAVTEVTRLAQAELPFAVGRYATSRYSLLRATPRTGRKHQIRRHLKHVFHPIVGDTTHGDGRHNRFFREHFHCQRLLLAATELRITHPYTQQALHITASPGEEFVAIMDSLGWGEALTTAPQTSAEADRHGGIV